MLENVGSNGWIWSASPRAVGSGNAGSFYLNSNGNVNPFGNDNRANGFPVRCARVFTACLKRDILRVILSREATPPASGLRNNSSGALNNVGNNGYVWSASPRAAGSTNGSFLAFNNNGLVEPFRTDNRAYAFPVRCARVFTAILSA